jgi:hypothetical protein
MLKRGPGGVLRSAQPIKEEVNITSAENSIYEQWAIGTLQWSAAGHLPRAHRFCYCFTNEDTFRLITDLGLKLCILKSRRLFG